MNTVRGIARDLVDKRLWPVAALLGLGILAALALALSASGAEPAPPAGAAAPGAGLTSGVVVPADQFELNADRDLLGDANDPFRRSAGGDPSGADQALGGAAVPTGGADSALALGGGAVAGGDAPSGGGGGAPSGGGGSAPSGGGGSPSGGSVTNVEIGPVKTPEPAARREPDRTFTMWKVDTRVFRDGKLVRKIGDVAPLTPLPTAGRPAALFLGVFNGGTSAGFVIHRFVDVRGSNCEDRAKRDCSLLRLSKGGDATLTFEEKGKQISYRVIVDNIRKVTTRDEGRAKRHRERRSSFGACLLKTVGQDYGAVLFDPAQGTWSAGGDPDDCYKR